MPTLCNLHLHLSCIFLQLSAQPVLLITTFSPPKNAQISKPRVFHVTCTAKKDTADASATQGRRERDPRVVHPRLGARRSVCEYDRRGCQVTWSVVQLLVSCR